SHPGLQRSGRPAVATELSARREPRRAPSLSWMAGRRRGTLFLIPRYLSSFSSLSTGRRLMAEIEQERERDKDGARPPGTSLTRLRTSVATSGRSRGQVSRPQADSPPCPRSFSSIDFDALDDEAEAVEAEAGGLDGGAGLADFFLRQINLLGAHVVVEFLQLDQALQVGRQGLGGALAGCLFDGLGQGLGAIGRAFDEVFQE